MDAWPPHGAVDVTDAITPEPVTPRHVDPPRGEPEVDVRLTDEPIDVAAGHAAVARADCGGIAVFAGVVRDHHEGVAVTGLVYEAWEDRAVPAMEAVARGVLRDFPGVRVAHVAHRTGPLAVGDVAVVTAASAPHRAEAIAACQALIDRVKAEVPVWKREELAAGGHRWPENAEALPPER